MKRSVLVVLAVLLVTVGWGIAKAQTKGNVYSNKFVGLTFSVPDGWYIATDKQTKGLMPDAARVMGLDDPVAKATVAQMPGKVLLLVSERPFSSDVQSVRNIIFVAINAREMKTEVRSGADLSGSRCARHEGKPTECHSIRYIHAELGRQGISPPERQTSNAGHNCSYVPIGTDSQ